MKRKIFLDKISNYHTDVVKKIINEHDKYCYSIFNAIDDIEGSYNDIKNYHSSNIKEVSSKTEENYNDIKNYNNNENRKKLDFSKYEHSRYNNEIQLI